MCPNVVWFDLESSRAEPTCDPRRCCAQALALSKDGTRHQGFLRPVPSDFEAAFSKGRTAPEVTLRGTMGFQEQMAGNVR